MLLNSVLYEKVRDLKRPKERGKNQMERGRTDGNVSHPAPP
jgi:hypothetical protein